MRKCYQNYRWLLVLCCMVLMMVNSDNYFKAFGCLEEEKIGLLKLKDFFINHNRSVDYGEQMDDCCKWKGVTCGDDMFSKRINNLSLSINSLISDEWFMNATWFQPFQQLQSLAIHGASMQGSHIRNLCFSVYVVLTLIRTINYFLTLGFKGRVRLTKLQVLYLSNNAMTDAPLMGELPSLKFLDLTQNSLMSHAIPGLCTLINLEVLDLSYNAFEGVLPACFSNLTSLRFLDLSRNEFSGTIPSNLFSGLKSLQYVSLSHNLFDGLFSFNSLEDNSKIEVFRLENDNPMLQVETENARWKPQLKIFALSNCILNEPSGKIIPSFLLTQYDLRLVDLSNNGMNGEPPTWLLTNNSRLEYLRLRNNSFNGPLMLQLRSYNAYMLWFDISNNQVAGEIPTFIGSILPNLISLDMSSNAIEGRIPSSIKNMTELIKLDLSNNHIYGEIPEDLFYGCENLQILQLSNNNLTTFLPLNSTRLPLTSLLEVFDISYNSFTGRFQDLITELSSLRTLKLSQNHFEGNLPPAFCNLKNLEILDLSWNNFTDTLPPCTRLPFLSALHLQGNKFHGPLPDFLSQSSSLMLLDVSNNKLSGLIPAWINSCQDLTFLLLNGNIFHGSIPSQLCQLENLNILDLAANNFTGSIPPCLFQIPIGKSEVFNRLLDPVNILLAQMVSPHEGDYTLNISTVDQNFNSILKFMPGFDEMVSNYNGQVQFLTKSTSRSYRFKWDSTIWYFISGIDLSLNKLTGPIPVDIDNWENVHSLNLSNNHLNGSIPGTLSRIQILESLDLSHNMLSGKIPSDMSKLTSLGVFSVAYNNLSGPTITSNQFGTFDSSSYESNPLLCGPPLVKSCNGGPTKMPNAKPYDESEQNDSSFEIQFLWCFFGSFVVSCIGAFIYFYFGTNVPQKLLRWIGIEKKAPLRTTVELPWKNRNK